ncbi:MAG: dihydrofolate reductase [Eubacteriales bacterium]|nr:dihydrofolate reductase [Eubacteriales bacterium]
MLALIAAYAENRIIGKNGRIPWDLPADKHRFRDLTMGHVMVMGRRTYEEIGFPLPGRETIVVSGSNNFDGPHCTTVPSLGAALEQAAGRDVFVCGGAQLYREALPLADVLYLTEIHAAFDGDTQFPAFDTEDFVQTEQTVVAGALPCIFRTLRRKRMDYAQARAYVAGLTAQHGIVPGLGPMQDLLARLGNPQNRYPAVHIAGTNGKGSTLAMISSMLQAAGYRVGSYCSPAVFEERECWRVNGRMIPKEDYAMWMTRLRGVRRAMQENGQPGPTAFELETALAFCWMAQQNCDITVVECGMGGAEDATNVLSRTAVSVLTSIGMDHMKFLGDTIEAIARAKGGIIRRGVPVVLQGQNAAVEREIAAICCRQDSPLTVVRPEEIAVTRADAHGITLDYAGLRQLSVPLAGRFQADNAATAIAAVRSLREFSISEQAIRDGLEQTRWPGRMEQICDEPEIVIDGAHNPDAAQRLQQEAKRRWPQGELIEMVGVLADKDFTEVGRLLAPMAREIITVTPDNARALEAEQLVECLRQFCPRVTAADSVAQALELAKQAAAGRRPILAFGSLSWLHTLRRAVEGQQ